MELRITNPEENGFLKEIQWNQEEVESWVAARVQDYKTIAYTADQAKDMKRDRADLNKLKAAFEDERKRLKKACMEPYNRFEPPKSTSKKKAQQMLAGELHVMKKPDIDNIVKVVADALNGVAYKDDIQIVFVAAKKAYSAEEGLDVIVEEYKATE